MTYRYHAKSDIGASRPVNQDAIYSNVIKTAIGKAFLGVICDGVGGLSDGEIASSAVVRCFSEWFLEEFRYIRSTDDIFENVKSQWSKLVEAAQQEISALISQRKSNMGTTLSALLLAAGKYFVVQVGDSRVYLNRAGNIKNITTDHSYVMELAQKGFITYDEACLSKKKNILTRCIGPNSNVRTDFYTGDLFPQDCFILSSDGFHGGLTVDAVSNIIKMLCDSETKETGKLIERIFRDKMEAGEKDNISLIFVKAIK